MLATPEHVASVVTARWKDDWSAGLPRFDKVPSTAIRCFLQYLKALDEPDRTTLFNALGKKAAWCVRGTPEGARLLPEEDATSKAAFDHVGANAGWSLRLLKNLVGFKRTGNKLYDRYVISAEEMAVIDALTSCKAPALRKLIKSTFAPALGLTPRNDGGGDWAYLPKDSEAYWVSIDFGGMHSQLRCELSLARNVPVRTLSYEDAHGLVGIGSFGWDWITEENAPSSIDLLTEQVRELIEMTRAFGLL